jgi:hypothetical protein
VQRLGRLARGLHAQARANTYLCRSCAVLCSTRRLAQVFTILPGPASSKGEYRRGRGCRCDYPINTCNKCARRTRPALRGLLGSRPCDQAVTILQARCTRLLWPECPVVRAACGDDVGVLMMGRLGSSGASLITSAVVKGHTASGRPGTARPCDRPGANASESWTHNGSGSATKSMFRFHPMLTWRLQVFALHAG